MLDPLLVARHPRDVRGGPLPGIRLHRRVAVQEETHLPGDARGLPLLPRAKRPHTGEALPDRRALARRRLLRPSQRVSVPALGDQRRGDFSNDPAAAEISLLALPDALLL